MKIVRGLAVDQPHADCIITGDFNANLFQGGEEIPRLRRQAITLGVMIAVNVFINIVLYRLVERAVFYSPRVQSCAGLQDEAGGGQRSSQNPQRSLLKTSLCLHPVSQDNLPDRQGRLPGQSCPRVRNEPETEDSSPWRDLQPHLRETLCLHKALVTLDPDTANEDVILSEDGRRVTRTDPRRTLHTSVRGREGFTSGRHYWEVQVLQEWEAVGVAGEALRGGADTVELPECRGWGVPGTDGARRWSLVFSPSRVYPRLPPLKLGLYLDYEGGRVSLYNADTLKHLCTFKHTFTGGLHPYFILGAQTELRLV
ncbi:E3 ubiquitin-protein ligase TRIM39-like [Lissotriton helveticus]